MRWRIGQITALWILLLAGPSSAQEPQALIESWYKVQKGEGGLVIVLDSESAVSAVAAKDDSGADLDSVKWEAPTPVLRQLRLPPGLYTVQLPVSETSPVTALEVRVKDETLTYLQLRASTEPAGIQFVSWQGPPSGLVKVTVETLALKGYSDLIVPRSVRPSNNVILFNTDPPFAIPPPPKP